MDPVRNGISMELQNMSAFTEFNKKNIQCDL